MQCYINVERGEIANNDKGDNNKIWCWQCNVTFTVIGWKKITATLMKSKSVYNIEGRWWWCFRPLTRGDFYYSLCTVFFRIYDVGRSIIIIFMTPTSIVRSADSAPPSLAKCSCPSQSLQLFNRQTSYQARLRWDIQYSLAAAWELGVGEGVGNLALRSTPSTNHHHCGPSVINNIANNGAERWPALATTIVVGRHLLSLKR